MSYIQSFNLALILCTADVDVMYCVSCFGMLLPEERDKSLLNAFSFEVTPIHLE